MWIFCQSTGKFSNADATLSAIGYSGNGEDLDDPSAQEVKDHGPIPQGKWLIGEFFDQVPGKGPVICTLTPDAETETYGRSGFMIHGDNKAADHTASEGCIILPRQMREAIRDSKDHVLQVIA